MCTSLKGCKEQICNIFSDFPMKTRLLCDKYYLKLAISIPSDKPTGMWDNQYWVVNQASRGMSINIEKNLVKRIKAIQGLKVYRSHFLCSDLDGRPERLRKRGRVSLAERG